MNGLFWLFRVSLVKTNSEIGNNSDKQMSWSEVRGTEPDEAYDWVHVPVGPLGLSPEAEQEAVS